MAAFLCTEAVAETVKPGDHSGTYVGNPVVCAAANAAIEQEKLVERSDAKLGARLLGRLRAFAEANPSVSRGARGRGGAVETVLRLLAE